MDIIKKIKILILCCLILSFLLVFVNKKESINDKKVTSAADASPSVSKDEKKVVNVIDETGAKRELRMEEIDTKDKGVYLLKTDWISNYSQVLDGHYYYLRNSNDFTYTVYQDQGDKVVSFDMPWAEDGDDLFYQLKGFAKYGQKFYILMSHFIYSGEDPVEFAYLDTEKISMKQEHVQSVNPIVITDVTEDHMMDDENIVFCNIYKNSLYFDSRTIWQKEEKRSGIFIQYDLTGENIRKELSAPLNMTKAKPYLTYIDGKIYYGVATENKVTIYSYDMRTKTEDTIFFYERGKKYNSDNIFISIDEDYIYCQDYLIPRSGGKMSPVFRNAKKDENGIINYSYNKKYIFYIDKKNKVHRISKKTKKDIVISKHKAVRIDCTEDSLYIRVRDKVWNSELFRKAKWAEEDLINPDCYSDHLYCTDLDGRNENRIWKGGYRETK